MKTVKEVCVKMENKPGELSRINELLAAGGIIILALGVKAQGTVGDLNFVTNDPARTSNILKSSGYDPITKDVLAVEIPHHPGGLHAVLKTLRLAGINVEHLYSSMGSSGCSESAVLLLGVDDIATASDVLSKEWIKLYGEEFYNF